MACCEDGCFAALFGGSVNSKKSAIQKAITLQAVTQSQQPNIRDFAIQRSMGLYKPPGKTDTVRKTNVMRGKTGLTQDADEAKIAGMVKEIMQACGSWEEVGEVCAKDCSGFAGSKTFMINAMGAKPETVFMHSRCEMSVNDLTTEKRTEASAQLFDAAGVGPHRIAQGKDWFLESSGGTRIGQPDAITEESVTPGQLGEFLAKIHRLDTSWYEPYRAKLRSSLPVLKEVSDESHIWWWLGLQALTKMDQLTQASMTKFAKEDFFAPTSRLGKRLVTCHGDFHPANIVKGESELKVIDFELSCVRAAVQDLAWPFALWCKEPAKKREFITAYAKASGGGDADVNALIVDAEIAAVGLFFFSPLAETLPSKTNPEGDLELYAAYEALTRKVRAESSAELAKHQGDFAAGYVEYMKKMCVSTYPESPAQDGPIIDHTSKEMPTTSPIVVKASFPECSVSCWWKITKNEEKAPQAYTIFSSDLTGGPNDFCLAFAHKPLDTMAGKKGLFIMHNNGKMRDGFMDGKIGFAEEPYDKEDGRWHHLVYVYSSRSCMSECFLDGVLCRPIFFEEAQPVQLARVHLGTVPIPVLMPFPKDSLKSVCLYNRKLKASEVLDLFHAKPDA